MTQSADNSSTPDNSPSFLHRATKNFGKLLRGRGVAAVLELLTIALMARALSPELLGNIVLIQGYALVVRGLFNFKLYEVLVRFGVPLLEADNKLSFKRLLRLTLMLDFLSSSTAAAVAIIAAPITGKILGWDDSLSFMTMMYCTALVTFGFGTAKGILRIFDRYDVLGIQLMIGPILRLGGVLLVIAINPTVFLFIIALMFALVVENIYLIVRGLMELRRQIGSISFKGSVIKGWREEFPGLGKFVRILYWQSNVDMLPQQVSVLLAGAFLGSAGAGLLRLGRETTKILSKPGALLRQVLFPDLVRLWFRGAADFKLILVRAMLISGLFGLFFITASIFGGAALLRVALGPDYAAAAHLVTLLLLSTTIELLVSVLRAAGYAIGHAGVILRFYLFSTALYLVLFVVLTPATGLIGPGLAACIASLVPLAGIGLIVRNSIQPNQKITRS